MCVPPASWSECSRLIGPPPLRPARPDDTDYLTHAHIIDPWDPLVCFQLALCYLGRAFQRQCDNRNHCIAQVRRPGVCRPLLARADPPTARAALPPSAAGQMVAFLDKYRANHPLGPDCDEVDYNYGTVFHRLGAFPCSSSPAGVPRLARL